MPDSYDSLLGKIIAWAPAREQAARRLAAALDATRCVGVASNERWLARVLRSAEFLAVRHDIALIDRGGAAFAAPASPAPGALILAALAAHARRPAPGRSRDEPVGAVRRIHAESSGGRHPARCPGGVRRMRWS